MKEISNLIKNSVVTYYEKKLQTGLTPICYHPGGIEMTDKTVEDAGINENCTVLDLASGPGETAFYLATKFGCRLVGVDLSRKMVEYATNLVKGVELDHQVKFIAADIEKLPLKDDSFDFAICECSLCLVPDRLATLFEIKRVTKPQGKVIISDVFWKENLPKEMKNFLLYANCISGAKTLEDYVSEFRQVGLTEIKTADLSFCVIKQLRQFLENQKIDEEKILANGGKFQLGTCGCKLNMETLQEFSFYLWLSGKIGYCMINAIKP